MKLGFVVRVSGLSFAGRGFSKCGCRCAGGVNISLQSPAHLHKTETNGERTVSERMPSETQDKSHVHASGGTPHVKSGGRLSQAQKNPVIGRNVTVSKTSPGSGDVDQPLHQERGGSFGVASERSCRRRVGTSLHETARNSDHPSKPIKTISS